MKTRLITLLACAVMAQEVVGAFLGMEVETYDNGKVEFSAYEQFFRNTSNRKDELYRVYEISGSNISSITIPKFWYTNDILKIDTGRGLFDEEIQFDNKHRTNRTKISFDDDFIGFLCIDGSYSGHQNSLGQIYDGVLCDDYSRSRLHRKKIFHHYKDNRYSLWRYGVDIEIVYDDCKIYADKLLGSFSHIVEITSNKRFVNMSDDIPIPTWHIGSRDVRVFAPIEMFPFFIRKGKKQLIALGGEGLELSFEVKGSEWHKVNWAVSRHRGLALSHIIFEPPKGVRQAFYRIKPEPTLGDIPSVVIDE